jgi:hypothetical protein
VVEQEKGEKAGQNPEHRAENSEPECEIPARVGDGIGFCFDHFLGFLVSYSPLAAIPNRAACPSNDESIEVFIFDFPLFDLLMRDEIYPCFFASVGCG